MIIYLGKFGAMLSSRQAGKEAYNAFLPTINSIPANEEVMVDFADVDVFTPSWGDEFLTPLLQKIGDRLKLMAAANPSVQMTLQTLEQVHNIKFTVDLRGR